LQSACPNDLTWEVLSVFNEILFDSEKEGGLARAHGCMDMFRRTLESFQLEDLGYVGDPFTWRYNWHIASGYIMERLDRVVDNAEWRCMFRCIK
jgi:hypothetical protein